VEQPPVVVPPVEPPPVEPATIVAVPEQPTPAEPATVVPPAIVAVPEEPPTVGPTTIVPPPVAPASVVPPPAAPAPVVTQPQIPPIEGISGASQAQNIYLILEDGRPGVLNSIYFEPETAVLIELYRSVLNAVGRRLAADPSLNLLIRAYTADFGTMESQYAVSSDRDVFSKNYLATEYGISANRFSSELFGSNRSPLYATEDWQTHRCVELILVRD
jgi:outer membrane protein OmpA-like peptidoglycan-associated protein